ncbi:RNA-directed DNA polymerase, eukaryota [Tanacetum coccineum]
MLNKDPKGVTVDVNSSLSHPPGFTPEGSKQENDHIVVPEEENVTYSVPDKENLSHVHPNFMQKAQVVSDNESNSGTHTFNHSHKAPSGGSILEILDGMIRVGQSMGYKMDGCTKDIERIIALQETKLIRISHMDVKFLWGNSNYQFVFSESVGNSGGILCVWEANVFHKDFVSVSDNFIALYGTWIPTKSKVLMIVIYAPQSPALKRVLWDYISSLISRWNGETVIMGDFNEVRSVDERLGSTFNHSSARVFNNFISSSGLVEVKMEGYSFTWSLSSGKKMSKLDRFLVSEEDLIRIDKNLDSGVCSDETLSNSAGFHRKKKQALIFKVDFAKAYDSVRWDYLLDVLHAFGFGPNGVGDPLAPYLFILIMESLHISFSRAVSDGFFKGIDIQGSTSISHLFYADDAVFIGEWSEANLVNLVRILKCFYLLAFGWVVGVEGGVRCRRSSVYCSSGCAVLQTPFKYLGISVGNQMSRKSAWENTIQKLHSRLSKWKVKTLSVGGRLTLLKSVLGSSPLYNMSIYKRIERIRMERYWRRANRGGLIAKKLGANAKKLRGERCMLGDGKARRLANAIDRL